jgi:hypothetical protein
MRCIITCASALLLLVHTHKELDALAAAAGLLLLLGCGGATCCCCCWLRFGLLGCLFKLAADLLRCCLHLQ